MLYLESERYWDCFGKSSENWFFPFRDIDDQAHANRRLPILPNLEPRLPEWFWILGSGKAHPSDTLPRLHHARYPLYMCSSLINLH